MFALIWHQRFEIEKTMKLQVSLGRIKEYKWLLTKGLGTPLLVLASLAWWCCPFRR